MSQDTAPRPIVPELLRPASGFAISASGGRRDVVISFDYDHPGAPGHRTTVAQVVVSAELLQIMHATIGRALDHLAPDGGPEPLSLAEMPPNVMPFRRQTPEPGGS